MKRVSHIFFLSTIALLYSAPISLAQEICNNGVDDNGDGLVDCYDPLCDGTPVCNYFFTGKPVIDCNIIPPVEPLALLWESPFNLETRSTVTVGDIDGDGVPEVICYKAGNSDIYILDGITGALELTIDALDPIYLQTAGPVIADTDGDGFGEIYVITENGPRLKCFEHNGTLKFSAATTVTNREEAPSIADFNGDGLSEVYVGNKIFHSLTGAFITSGGGGGRGNNVSHSIAATYPVAADVLPASACADCAGLELVCGNTVYAVNIGGATMTPQANSLGGLNDGWTSVADMNMDGQLDVIVVTGGNVYVWDPRTGLQMGNTFSIPNTSVAGGRANIADYDNDSIPEIGVGGSNRFVVIDIDTATLTLSQKWVKTIIDGSAATTGSAFDFEGDGFSEVVYRDENNLYIWDGATGTTKVQISCGSATRTEYPTIVDVDGDGHANIVCLCSPNNAGASGKVSVFQSTSNLWIPTREVMNQHTYSVVNINDDLSVPTNQQNHALLPRLNNFLAQTPLRDVNWDPILIPVSDVTVKIDSLVFTHCDSVNIMMTLCNQGDEIIVPGMDISFYNGDPLTGGVLISTVISSKTIGIDSCTTESFTIPYIGPFTLFAYANDDGSDPVNAPTTSFIECDSTNNMDSTFIQLVSLLTADFNVTGACVNEALLFTDSSNISAGTIVSWSWDFGDGDTSTLQNPSHVYLNDSMHSVTLIVTSDISCVDTLVLSVQAYSLPVADFTPIDDCVYDSAKFADITTINVGSIVGWSWDFGDTPSAGTSALPSPSYLYSSDGIYPVTLIVESNYGCFDTITLNTERFAIPVVDFTPVIVCLKDTTMFTDLTTVTNDSIDTWIWNFGDGSPQVFDQHPNHVFTLGTFNVSLTTISTHNCINDTTKPVGVYPIPVANFGSTSPCLGFATQFIDSSSIIVTSGDFIASWIWSFGDGDSSTLSDPSHTYTSDGAYNVQLIVISNNGCSDTIIQPVIVHPLPNANFSNTSVCATFITNFFDSSTVSSGSITSWAWDYDDGNTSSIQNDSNAYASGGMYSVLLEVTSNYGCVDDITIQVEVYPEPTADFIFDPETTTIINTLVDFTDLSTVSGDNLVSWLWNFGSGNIDTSQHTSFQFPTDTGLYPINLLVTTSHLCVNDITLYVDIDGDNMFYAPSAFLPNGQVAENQYFLPTGLGFDVDNYEMHIYDRWGDQIFSTKDINEPWYGNANHGNKLAQQDVYVWIIKAKDLLGKAHTYVGHVTLLQ